MRNNFCAFLLLFAINALALTEQEFIEKVISQDTNFEKDQIYVTIKQMELETSRASYSNWATALTASLSSSYYDIEKDTTSKKAYEKHRLKDTQEISVGIKKRFLSNPSSLTFKATHSIPDTDITRYKQDKISNEYNVTTSDNTYKVSYKYPLLQHDGNALSLKTYRRDVLDLEREMLDFSDAQEKFLVGRLKQYIAWNFHQENADIYRDYKSRLQAIKVNEATDESKLNTAILLANQDILSNDSKLQSLKKVLVSMLNDSSLWTKSPNIDINKHPEIMPNLTQYLQKNVRNLLKIEIDKRLKKIDLEYHSNQSLYQLDFNISAEVNNNKGNTMTTDYKSTSVLYTTRLNFSMPIGTDINNKKNIRITHLNLRKLDIDYNNKLKDIFSDAQALIVELHLAKKSLNEYQKLITNVNDESNLAHTSYLNKSVPITTLIDAYQEKCDVELDYIKALTSYQKSLLKYNDKLDKVLPKSASLHSY
ncbi:Channel-tunnel spanning the outer membrane and periplasm segregation of daughter chromosomes [Bathymodiolus thermophilus thioautotrophic gill symbiont]|uniref:TolC family protein n=1 Tax=Bathymodiolus thermophilus thioautotrophic gill symbiont TaxID=2360 RepID=UPI0010B3FB70|nr:TolC family protein [Bathymodiolus thermophilus thioautotrophic gill symbiont]SGZ94993.1 Channel-tunnel spanning the outer membrane and periplasm segregation of daughter chromosomes [Bathymodiolus thermophilus thioautotrophic gill symbiont]